MNAGTWNEIPKDKQILALKIETKKLKKELKKKPKKRNEKPPARRERRTKHGQKDEERHAWMYKEPKPGEKKIVKQSGKEWAWCKYHKKWVVKHTDKFGEHTSETCLLNPKNKDKKGRGQKKLAVEVEANAVNEEDGEGVPTDSDESMDVSIESNSSGDES